MKLKKKHPLNWLKEADRSEGLLLLMLPQCLLAFWGLGKW